jgi:hypothetical protein
VFVNEVLKVVKPKALDKRWNGAEMLHEPLPFQRFSSAS